MLDREIKALLVKMKSRLDVMESSISAGFDDMNAKFDQMDAKLAALKAKHSNHRHRRNHCIHSRTASLTLQYRTYVTITPCLRAEQPPLGQPGQSSNQSPALCLACHRPCPRAAP